MPWPSSITVRDVRVLDPSGRIERAAVVIGSEGAYVTEANAGPALDGLGLLACLVSSISMAMRSSAS
jgi:hypothetical protein